MNRRIPIVCLALAAATAASACSTVSTNNAVAEVGDEKLSRDELAALVVAPDDEGSDTTAGAATTDGSDTGADNGTMSGDESRQMIAAWVQLRLLQDGVAAAGGDVTDADRSAAQAALAEQQGFADLTENAQQLYLDLNAASTAWSRVNFDAEDHRASYEAGMQESGVACLAAIVAASEADAQEAIAEVDGGTEFADVARRRSTDASGQNGGELGCIPLAQAQQGLPPELVEVAATTGVGELSEAVEIAAGDGTSLWVVLMPLPFDDVVDELEQFFGQAAAEEQFVTLAEDGDVYVDPRFGQFNAAEGVVPLGGTSTPDPDSSLVPG